MSPRDELEAGPVDGLRAGFVRVVALPRDALGRPCEALLLRDGDGVVRAYLNRCLHLPIPIDGGSRQFLTDDGRHLRCGTHGALYRVGDGLCVEGPCQGESLIALPVRIVDGVVRVEAPGN